MATSLETARTAFIGRSWSEAFESFRVAAGQAPLEAGDLERLAMCAYLVGEDEASAHAWEAAHRATSEAGGAEASARCAFWLGFCLMMRGQMAQAGGWLARAERLIEDGQLDGPAAAYLLIPRLLAALGSGDPASARALAVQPLRPATASPIPTSAPSAPSVTARRSSPWATPWPGPPGWTRSWWRSPRVRWGRSPPASCTAQ